MTPSVPRHGLAQAGLSDPFLHFQFSPSYTNSTLETQGPLLAPQRFPGNGLQLSLPAPLIHLACLPHLPFHTDAPTHDLVTHAELFQASAAQPPPHQSPLACTVAGLSSPRLCCDLPTLLHLRHPLTALQMALSSFCISYPSRFQAPE